ncbi:MAG: NADH-quinone oxidoreductase subunit NuoG [Chloroflexi bacterium]|nr:NADH-quinone oxidoreductase subunit NuoG [Chloroflexota bacterium]
MSDWITITIDGKEIKAKKGELLTAAAKRGGIEIPVFCSHPKLDPLGACRMCLVEAETRRGKALITACTTPVNDGAVYYYNSERARDARQGTLELILINHPLDCPICDKGGECPLQDQTLEHGPGHSHFWEEKTHKTKHYPLSDLIMLDQERCIVCWRCIRYLQEWEDKPQLGLFHRGGETVIDKFPAGKFDAATSGSVIDICPVGALTNRLSRFSYRPWELDKTDSICTHCGQGCNLRIDSRSHRVRRNVARENPAVNDEWICDKGRFATGFSYHPERLQQPLARMNGKLEPVSWQEAIQQIVAGLQNVSKEHGPEAVGALGSAKLSNEANYLLGKFMRGMVGSNNVDYREGSAVLADPRGLPALGDVHDADLIVLMGADPSEEMPVLANFIKRAAKRRGVKLIIVHPRRIELSRYPGIHLAPMPGQEVDLFDALTRASLQAGGEAIPGWLPAEDGAWNTEDVRAAGQWLAQAQKPFIVYGADYAWGFGARDIVTALSNWAVAAGHDDRLGFLHAQANAQGAGDVGLLPNQLPGRRPLSDDEARSAIEALWQTRLPRQPGLGYGGMMAAAASGHLKAMIIMGADPVGEKPSDAAALDKLEFLVVQDLFLTETAIRADVVLPAASYVESEGSFTNTERRLQRAPRAVKPMAKSVPDWAILMHLAQAYWGELPASWQTLTIAAVFAEITRAVPQYAGMSWENMGAEGRQWQRSALEVGRELRSHDPGFDPTDRKYPFHLIIGNQLWDQGTTFAATTEMAHLGVMAARLHPSDAVRLQVTAGDRIRMHSGTGEITAPVVLDDSISPNSVFVPFSFLQAPVGELFDRFGQRTAVAISKVSN